MSEHEDEGHRMEYDGMELEERLQHMSEPLSHEQVEKLVADICDDTIATDYPDEPKRLLAHDAALRAELVHWREACCGVGETDGHGWAETTKELRAENERLRQANDDLNNSLMSEASMVDDLRAQVTALEQERDDLYNQLHVYKTVYGGT